MCCGCLSLQLLCALQQLLSIHARHQARGRTCRRRRRRCRPHGVCCWPAGSAEVGVQRCGHGHGGDGLWGVCEQRWRGIVVRGRTSRQTLRQNVSAHWWPAAFTIAKAAAAIHCGSGHWWIGHWLFSAAARCQITSADKEAAPSIERNRNISNVAATPTAVHRALCSSRWAMQS